MAINDSTQLKTRYLVIKMILDSSTFPSGDAGDLSTKTVFASSNNTDLSASAQITKQEGYEASSAVIKIFGLGLDTIEAFSRFQRVVSDPLAANTVEVYAGYDLNSDGLPPFIYRGVVTYAYPDYNQVDRPFIINSITGVIVQNQLQKSINLHGLVSLDDVFRNIISNAGLAYQPYQPLTQIARNPNIPSMGMTEQLDFVCKHYGLQYKVSDDYRSVYVTKLGQPSVPLQTIINADNYLLGYPIALYTAIEFMVRFNPNIQFGQQITLQSYMSLANGSDWYINAITHNLETKGRMWESIITVQAYQYGA